MLTLKETHQIAKTLKTIAYIIGGLLLTFHPLFAQESETLGVSPILALRAEESYAFLQNKDSLSNPKMLLQPLKWISLDKNIHLTLGGEYRPRIEHYTNRDYTQEDETFYSQRLSLHASLSLGAKIRFFGEIYHGYASSGHELLESDEIDLHQAFLEWKIFQNKKGLISLRLGRQEIGYGASRLIGIREGPNMRRSFDMARLILTKDKGTLNIIYGRETSVNFKAFDNDSFIFHKQSNNPILWGAYWQHPLHSNIRFIDLYYFGFRSNVARFNDVLGEELRHSVGVRSFGRLGRFSYNTEFTYQFGKLGGSSIAAFNLETDWQYQLAKGAWKPTLGIKLDWSSGDTKVGDDKVQTFNPMFVNPAIYSLAAVNTPANIISVHPSFSFNPFKNFSVYIDYALFYRTEANDGVYSPPRFLTRPANGNAEQHIGDVLGLMVNYEINRNISFDLRSSYFIPGKFLKDAGAGATESTFYIAPTLSFKF